MSDGPVLLRALEGFLAAPLDAILGRHRLGGAERRLLAQLRGMAERVPAYRQLLASHGLGAADIRGVADLARLPVVSKDSYYRSHALAELCWDGTLVASDTIAMSSGSTGDPAVWPRCLADEIASAERFEQVFRDSFRADQRTTLAVVCFALGTWVGGMYTTSCLRLVAAKGYPITVATPGNQPQEILRVLRQLAPAFDQVVLLGYPPFLKDVIDTLPGLGYRWPAGRVRLVTAGECTSEAWRTLVTGRLGSTQPALDTAALYGTADGGVLANETPLSIAIRRQLAAHPEAHAAVFGSSRMPTLCQYDPAVRWFEASDGQLLFSADGGVPLARYRILDHGGIASHEAMLATLRRHGCDPLAGLPGGTPVRDLPFVWVFGRMHVALSLDGANIYPEHIAGALERPPLCDQLTGKFVMRITDDADHNPRLAVVLELLPGAAASSELAASCAAAVAGELMVVNSEYAAYVPAHRRLPLVVLRPHRHPEDFPPGIKHRAIR
jgi:phenylacetate-CoA ligase